MTVDQEEPRKGFLPKLDAINKGIAVLAAIASLASGVLAFVVTKTRNELDVLQAQVQRLQSERAYATDIYTRFDKIVTDTSEGPARVARLNGLLALTELVGSDQVVLKQKLASLIEDQSRLYAAAAPEAEKKQFADLAAKAGRVAVGTSWTNYDFDIFWCASSGEGARKTAEQIRSLRAEDPTASGEWRVRRYSGSDVNVNRILYDYPDEKALALGLQNLVRTRTQRPFIVQTPRTQTTRWYLSVWVCQS